MDAQPRFGGVRDVKTPQEAPAAAAVEIVEQLNPSDDGWYDENPDSFNNYSSPTMFEAAWSTHYECFFKWFYVFSLDIFLFDIYSRILSEFFYVGQQKHDGLDIRDDPTSFRRPSGGNFSRVQTVNNISGGGRNLYNPLKTN